MSNIMVAQATVEVENGDQRFSKVVEMCLLRLVRELDIPIPLWLTKNTKEFARFHQTIFFRESFSETVKFDRFRIKWIDDGR